MISEFLIEVLVNEFSMTSCNFLVFFIDTATTEIYTLSLHDALPIFHYCFGNVLRKNIEDNVMVLFLLDKFFCLLHLCLVRVKRCARACLGKIDGKQADGKGKRRSEEHTSELQSQSNLVCRLLLEKKK